MRREPRASFGCNERPLPSVMSEGETSAQRARPESRPVPVRLVSLLALIDSLAPGSLTDDTEEVDEAALKAAIAADLGGIAGREVEIETGQARRLLRVYQANVAAMRRYRPAADAPGIARVALLRAGERPGGLVTAPDLGWSGLAPGDEPSPAHGLRRR